MGLRILIVDDHTILRQGLIALLQTQLPGTQIREASNGIAAVVTCAEWSPDIVIMDISLPQLGGLEATRQILSKHPNTRILMLTGHDGGQLAAEATNSGAKGLVPKDTAFEELVVAIRSILAGETYFSGRVPANNPSKPAAPDEKNHLTSRERDVLELLAEGQSMKEVARQLDVSIKTVETHRRKIMDKLGMFSIAELTKYALITGLTPLYGRQSPAGKTSSDNGQGNLMESHGA